MFGGLKDKFVMKAANGYLGTEDTMKRMEFRMNAQKELQSTIASKNHAEIIAFLEGFFNGYRNLILQQLSKGMMTLNPLKLVAGTANRFLMIETADKSSIKMMLLRNFEQCEFQHKEVMAILREVQQRLKVQEENLKAGENDERGNFLNINIDSSAIIESLIEEIKENF
jgi:hypothetical protein